MGRLIDFLESVFPAKGTSGGVPVEIVAGGGGGGGGGAVTVADGADVTQGAKNGTAVITDADGTIQQYLRGLVKLWLAKLNIKVASGDIASGAVASGAIASGAVASGAIASGAVASGAVVDGGVVTLGTTSDTGVITDTTGTVIGFLRGIVKLIIAKLAVKVASGDIASGAIASGAVASGAVASGAIASGAVASGAVASGAVVDGAIATLGLTTNDAASSTSAEDTTARTGIGLWKAIKNILILLVAKFPTALLVPDVFTDLNGVAIGTIATVWTPVGATKIRLMGGCISLSATASVLFEDNNVGNTIFRTPILPAGQPYNFDLGNGKGLSTNSHVLKATASATASITGTLYGKEE